MLGTERNSRGCEASMMDLDELVERGTRLLHEAGISEAISSERRITGDVERWHLTRNLPNGTRYLRATPCSDRVPTWDFEVLLSSYGNVNGTVDLDGRRGGDGDYTINLIRLWLVELADWSELRLFDARTERS